MAIYTVCKTMNKLLFLLLVLFQFLDKIYSWKWHGLYLNRTPFKSLNNIGIQQCAKTCLMYSSCLSINYYKPGFSCSLNNVDSETNSLTTDPQYVYSERTQIKQNFIPTNTDTLCGDLDSCLSLGESRTYCVTYCFPKGCNDRLNWLSNNLITASASSTSTTCSVEKGMLHTDGQHGSAWCADSKTNSPNEFFQFEFNTLFKIKGIITQGRADYIQWVITYKVNISTDMTSWSQIEQEFSGNSDKDTTVTNFFSSDIITKYMRIIPILFNRRPAIRIDLIGCIYN